MPTIRINDLNTWYDRNGEGIPLVFVHGAFVSSKMWEPQIKFFTERGFEVTTYDVRGHGNTGLSSTKKYSIELFADDLFKLLQSLELLEKKPIICGLSMGGMIAQIYATKYVDTYSALILSDTAATLTLTWWDKFMRYFVGPKWLMILSLRMMGVHRFIRFSFWLAEKTRSKEWLGNKEIIEYEKGEMIHLDKKEYLKIFAALYDFKLQELRKISVPTLVLNGIHEPKSLFKHAEKIQSLIPICEVDVIPNAGHVTNLENSRDFNERIQRFLRDHGIL